MSKSSFWMLFFSLHLMFIFIKIYQHNVYVNEVFKQQKLLSQKKSLRLKIDNLYKRLMSLKDKDRLIEEATELNMKPVQLAQIKNL